MDKVTTIQSLRIKKLKSNVYEYKWGMAIRNPEGEWETLFLAPDGRKVDVRGIEILLSDDGIEFI